MTMTQGIPNRPDHVPPELVLPYPLLDREYVHENPWDELAIKVHEGPPVFWANNVFPGGVPGWVVRRAEDLRTIYADTEHFVKRGNTRVASMIGEDWDVIPTELDPPKHTAFRSSLNPVFSPRRMGALDDSVRIRARAFIDKFKARGECEFVEDMSIPYPISIFLDMLGLPQELMPQFLVWEHTLLHSNDLEARIDAVRAVKDYLLGEIEVRRKNPGDDLISQALNFEVWDRKWTAEEVFGFCFNLYLGGLDTVSSNLGIHMYHLATRPDDQAWIRANPGKLVPAVEELLRAYAAVTTWRICDKEFEIGGVTMKPGDRVAMSTTLAARDPEDYDCPSEVRFDRKPSHLTFGFGPHRCLGCHLARRELQIGLQELLSALPPFRIKEGADIRFFSGNVIHMQSLPLVWDI